MKIKKLLSFSAAVLSFAVSLSACGVKTESDMTPWPTHAPGATPYVCLMDKEEGSALSQNNGEVYDSYTDFLRSLYKEVGHFYFIDWEMEMFQGLDQGQPFSFVVHTEPGANVAPEMQAVSDEIRAVQEQMLELYDSAIVGDKPENYYCEPESGIYPWCVNGWQAHMDPLPEEWYTLQETLIEKLCEQESTYRRLDNEYALAAAQEFAAQGCSAQVRCMTNKSDGVEYSADICVISITPERLWELSETMDGLYFIEQLYDGVSQRFDTVVWSSEEGA